jgi:hypothetical protein
MYCLLRRLMVTHALPPVSLKAVERGMLLSIAISPELGGSIVKERGLFPSGHGAAKYGVCGGKATPCIRGGGCDWSRIPQLAADRRIGSGWCPSE